MSVVVGENLSVLTGALLSHVVRCVLHYKYNDSKFLFELFCKCYTSNPCVFNQSV